MKNILLVGKPNVGKTLLFNKLTGLSQKVSNFPGVTVEIKKGKFQENQLIDFPGTYSVYPISSDEQVAIDQFKKYAALPETKLICVVLDLTRLELSLILGLQILKLSQTFGKPVLFVGNMMDELLNLKIQYSIEELARELKSPFIPISAKKNLNIEELAQKINNILSDINLEKKILTEQSIFQITLNEENIKSLAKNISKKIKLNLPSLVQKQIKIDQFLLAKFFGPFFFLLTMFFLFQLIFTWAIPFMDAIEGFFTFLGELVLPNITNPLIKNLIKDAILGGIGSFLVFVPQIFFLTFIIGILEDSGYLARATILSHKVFSFFGLGGKSFVPYLSAFACAIPAIFASRNIESPRKRLMTILTIPLIPCSARLPVYALLISFLIPYKSFLGGIINSQGIAFAALYLLGTFITLVISLFLSLFLKNSKNESKHDFILELPSYRIPHLLPLLKKAFYSCYAFITKAGPIIFAVTFIVWGLGYFPLGEGQLELSYLSKLGHFLSPVFEPMGLDWKYTVCILTSFLAREVFVVTLATIMGIQFNGEDNNQLIQVLHHSGLTIASGISLLFFYAVALQCASTVAVIKQETGKWKYAIGALVGYNSLAYILSFLIYKIIIFF